MANNARTISDLERKYDFKSLLGLKKNVKINERSIFKVQNELSNMLNTLIINLKDVLGNQGEVSLWFYSEIPSINNEPYIKWEKPEEHYGDIYYNQETGYVYQFFESGWIRNTDSNLVQAMALTNVELDTTTDHERKVYFVQPNPPYSSGDWWILEDGTLKICQIGRMTGGFESNDFIVSSKYVATVASKTGDVLTVLKGTVTEITENYVKYTDLSTGGSTVINGSNITTGTINTDNVAIGNGNVLINKEGIKLNNGAKIVGKDGLMNTYLFTNKEGFEICGYEPDSIGGPSTVHRKGVRLIFNIPDELNIISARLILHHAPVLWGWLDMEGIGRREWGACRNIIVSKGNDVYNRIYESQLFSEYFESDNSSYQVINDVFGGMSWSPTIPNDKVHNVEKIISTDIKSNLNKGLNELLIQPMEDFGDTILNPETFCKESGFLNVMIKIDGYMSYE